MTLRGRSSSSTPRRGAGGFTLTDLLVTVAVATTLVALGVGALVAAQRKARLRQCLANLQQVNRAVLAFATEHQDTLPGIEPGVSRDLWWWYKEQVKSHAGLTGPSSPQDAVFACPSDRGYTDPKPFHANPRFDYTSYVLNAVTLPGMPNIAGWRVAAIAQPARTLLTMEWTAHAPLSWHHSRTGRANAPFYNDARSVVGFVDGHVSDTPIYYDGFTAAYTRDPIDGYAYRYSGR